MSSEDVLTDFARAVGYDIKNIHQILGTFSGFELNNLTNSDLLQYKDGKWINIKKETVSDGGNF